METQMIWILIQAIWRFYTNEFWSSRTSDRAKIFFQITEEDYRLDKNWSQSYYRLVSSPWQWFTTRNNYDHDVALRRTLSSIPEQLCWHRYVNLKVILIITKHTRNNVRTHCIVNMHLVGIAGIKVYQFTTPWHGISHFEKIFCFY